MRRTSGAITLNVNHDLEKEGRQEMASPEYYCWRDMKARCYNPANKSFHNYGGRGITVCDRWLHSFENFLADMGPRPSPQHTIDRDDNARNYTPDNCWWRTRLEQAHNRRTNVLVTHGGVKKCIKQWSRDTGLSAGTIGRRIRAGWPKARLFDQPRTVSTIEIGGKRQSVSAWARESGLTPWAIRHRLNAGRPQAKLFDRSQRPSNGWRLGRCDDRETKRRAP
jgi:hypothetical protein